MNTCSSGQRAGAAAAAPQSRGGEGERGSGRGAAWHGWSRAGRGRGGGSAAHGAQGRGTDCLYNDGGGDGGGDGGDGDLLGQLESAPPLPPDQTRAASGSAAATPPPVSRPQSERVQKGQREVNKSLVKELDPKLTSVRAKSAVAPAAAAAVSVEVGRSLVLLSPWGLTPDPRVGPPP